MDADKIDGVVSYNRNMDSWFSKSWERLTDDDTIELHVAARARNSLHYEMINWDRPY